MLGLALLLLVNTERALGDVGSDYEFKLYQAWQNYFEGNRNIFNPDTNRSLAEFRTKARVLPAHNPLRAYLEGFDAAFSAVSALKRGDSVAVSLDLSRISAAQHILQLPLSQRYSLPGYVRPSGFKDPGFNVENGQLGLKLMLLLIHAASKNNDEATRLADELEYALSESTQAVHQGLYFTVLTLLAQQYFTEGDYQRAKRYSEMLTRAYHVLLKIPEFKAALTREKANQLTLARLALLQLSMECSYQLMDLAGASAAADQGTELIRAHPDVGTYGTDFLLTLSRGLISLGLLDDAANKLGLAKTLIGVNDRQRSFEWQSLMASVKWNQGSSDAAKEHCEQLIKLRDENSGSEALTIALALKLTEQDERSAHFLRIAQTSESTPESDKWIVAYLIGQEAFGRSEIRVAEESFSLALAGLRDQKQPLIGNLASIYYQMACVKLASEKRDEAYYFTKQYLSLVATLERASSLLSEERSLAIGGSQSPFGLVAMLGDADLMMEVSLQNKGLILDTMSLTLRRMVRSGSEEDQKLLAKWRQCQRQIYSGTRTGSRSEVGLYSDLVMLNKRLADVSSAQEMNIRDASTKLRKLSRSVPIVDIVRYQHVHNGRNENERYGALIIVDGKTEWVQLGDPVWDAHMIDQLIWAYYQIVNGRRDWMNDSDAASKFGLSKAVSTDVALVKLNDLLVDKVWRPIESQLVTENGTRPLIVCPDAGLSFIPFAALFDSTQKGFLCSRYSITYVTSTRSIVRELNDQRDAPTRTVALFGDPEFTGLAAIDENAGGNDQTRLPALPATRTEVQRIGLLAQSMEFRTETFIGGLASEANLRKLIESGSPAYLHIATHGLEPVWPVWGETSSMDQAVLSNWRRIGLSAAVALSGSKAPGVPQPATVGDTDGIVSALEFSLLNLAGTRLITLSGCSTGSGVTLFGASDGIIGLRRGLAVGGAQFSLLALWPVRDQFTADIMAQFYNLALSGRDLDLALQEVMSLQLNRLYEQGGLLHAVKFAGPLVLCRNY